MVSIKKKTHAEEKHEDGVCICIPGFGVVGVLLFFLGFAVCFL